MDQSNTSGNKSYATYLLGGLLVIAAFFIGTLWTKVQNLEQGNPAVAGETARAPEQLPAQPAPAQAPPTQLGDVPEVTADDYVRGNPDAPIMLIEYSDYECPFCSRFHPTMEQVMQEYGDQVAWTFRHFPLSFHPQAQKLSEAAECVGDLGGNEAFWSFTDEAFTQNIAQSMSSLDTVVADIGVDVTEFNSCMDSGKFTQKVKDQMAAGQQAGVSGTPGTIVLTQSGESELISGALPFEQVKAVIEKYL